MVVAEGIDPQMKEGVPGINRLGFLGRLDKKGFVDFGKICRRTVTRVGDRSRGRRVPI